MKRIKDWKKKVYHVAKRDKLRTHSKHWVRLRMKVFKRDKFQCQRCLEFYGENSLTLEAHHIIPRPQGRTILKNLITLCPSCHDHVELNGLEGVGVNDKRLIKEDIPWQSWVYGGYKKPERARDLIRLIVCIIVFVGSLVLFSYNCHATQKTASWYDYQSCRKEGSSGVLTASGARFDHNALTCASWDFSFGTMLKITNTRNGKSVVVKVTDRGPSKKLYAKGRTIDLSRGAFQKIALLSDGVVPIKIEILKC